MSMNPTSKILFPKRASNSASNRMPTNPAGSIEIIILTINWVSSFHSNLNKAAKSVTISFLKIIKVLRAVAKWRTTVENQTILRD